jgi:phosphopantetheinyl transferase
MAMPLSVEEKDSLARATTPKRRREIDVSRRLIRYGLHAYLELPTDSTLHWGKKGPRSVGLPPSIGMSVAHSARHAAVALSTRGSVGVDVESTESPPAWQEIMTGFFCDQDVEWIARTDAPRGADGLRRFYAIWTAREAYAKLRQGSVLDRLSQPVLREWVGADGRDVRAASGRACRVEIFVGDGWIVALCRELHESMLPGMVAALEDDEDIESCKPVFVFLVEDHQ